MTNTRKKRTTTRKAAPKRRKKGVKSETDKTLTWMVYIGIAIALIIIGYFTYHEINRSNDEIASPIEQVE